MMKLYLQLGLVSLNLLGLILYVSILYQEI